MSRSPCRRQCGASLVEAMIVLAIIGLLLGSVLPGWADARDRRSLEAASAQLATDLRLTRSLAVAQGSPVRLSVPAAQACYVVHTGPARACSCDATGAATCRDDAQALRVATLPGSGRIALSSSSASMLFDADRGTVTPTGTLRLRLADGRAVH
ncbi:MAG: GspH/FimT family pseudopilin, partial [Betaproteobacteria bacterium]